MYICMYLRILSVYVRMHACQLSVYTCMDLNITYTVCMYVCMYVCIMYIYSIFNIQYQIHFLASIQTVR